MDTTYVAEQTIQRCSIETAQAIADRDCDLCGEETMVDTGRDEVCTNCWHAPDDRYYETTDGPWEQFWDHREEYSGFYGDERKKCVGGFTSPYF